MCPRTNQFSFGEESFKVTELAVQLGLLEELSMAVRKNTRFISFLYFLGMGFSLVGWALNSHSFFYHTCCFVLSKHRKLWRTLPTGLEKDSWK